MSKVIIVSCCLSVVDGERALMVWTGCRGEVCETKIMVDKI